MIVLHSKLYSRWRKFEIIIEISTEICTETTGSICYRIKFGNKLQMLQAALNYIAKQLTTYLDFRPLSLNIKVYAVSQLGIYIITIKI